MHFVCRPFVCSAFCLSTFCLFDIMPAYRLHCKVTIVCGPIHFYPNDDIKVFNWHQVYDHLYTLLLSMLTIDLSTHLPIFIMFTNIRQFNPKHVKIDYRIINDSTINKIYQSFSRDNLGNFIESIDYIYIDELINLLHSKKYLHFNIKTVLSLG